MPNESFESVCLSVILLNSVYKKDNEYYPQVFLEEFKHAVKEKKIYNHIIDDSEALLEKIQMEKNSDYKENSDKEKIKLENNSYEEN